jgi:hypothetical protein
MSQQSLVDLAVETLARVQAMGDGVGLEHLSDTLSAR